MADRWHLLKNIADVPERMMYRHMPLIRLVASELSPKKSPELELSVPAASLRRPERLKQPPKNGISVGQRLWPCITGVIGLRRGAVPLRNPITPNWPNVATFFVYPEAIRKVIYTTNAIESLNSVIRHAIKKRKVFPTDESVKKVVWLAIQSASQKWTMPLQDWLIAISHFIIEFGDRLDGHF